MTLQQIRQLRQVLLKMMEKKFITNTNKRENKKIIKDK